ncbi:hypothetical protein M404DRAFT_381734 [Pisolithus tinctorius Marx 270]|uniref:Uncharacterized protein n=1 Tax=Pisolithus tinctorius Marx 270 TaxID=870435 RepID=A0A0C3NFE2_PISTI|nr:hypothetical protein M404DRAFT_381734 [Pisolithus tinctorius Marx 270]
MEIGRWSLPEFQVELRMRSRRADWGGAVGYSCLNEMAAGGVYATYTLPSQNENDPSAVLIRCAYIRRFRRESGFILTCPPHTRARRRRGAYLWSPVTGQRLEPNGWQDSTCKVAVLSHSGLCCYTRLRHVQATRRPSVSFGGKQSNLFAWARALRCCCCCQSPGLDANKLSVKFPFKRPSMCCVTFTRVQPSLAQ